MGIVREIAWAAGFIEGEGYFGFSHSYPAITVRQCNIECLERLHGNFGGRIGSCKMSALGKQPVFEWVLGGKSAIALAMTIFPLLSKKRQGQALRAIEGWKSLKGTHGETHVKVAVKDQEALAIIRRVYGGESVGAVAKDVGMDHSTLHHWVAGRWRPELLAQIVSEGCFRSDVVGKRKRPQRQSDEVLRKAIQRVRAGENISVVADALAMGRPTLSLIVSGKNRSYLLAQVLREEAEALEEVCS